MQPDFSNQRMFIAVLALILAAGCGNKAKTPPLGEVSGVVTLDGTPLKNVDVVFTPDHARPSFGRTDDSGKYSLSFAGKEQGAAIGKHSVSISTPLDHPPAPSYKDPIPARYNISTELTADVKAGQQEMNFDLKSK
jgi:hypothetical protein